MPFGLTSSTMNQLNKVFTRFPEVETVVCYGSRAKGNFKQGSDIDLALKGTNINLNTLNAVTTAIDELSLPYLVDISIFSAIDNPDLIEHINRAGKIFYTRSS